MRVGRVADRTATPVGIAAVRRILGLWRGRAAILALGLALALAALAAAVALMTASGARIAVVLAGGGLAAGLALRLLGPARVVLRYAERLVTHDATFRALADLRVWLFRGMARGSAGGLGFRRSGDVLSRLVGDVEALDGLYLRILVPVAGALLLLPVLVVLLAMQAAWLAATVGLLFVAAAFVLPAIAARSAAAAGARLAAAESGLRVAVLDTLGALREVRAFGAETRMQAEIAGREATLLAAQRAPARRAAMMGGFAFLCAQAALLAVLLAAGFAHAAPAAAIIDAFLVVGAFEAIALLPRAGVLAGRAAVSAARVLEAAAHAPAAPDPADPAAAPASTALRFEGVTARWDPARPVVVDGLTMEIPPGSRVALLGPSGAGKSTLAALVLRVLAPERGRVLLGGVDIATVAAADLRGRVAWLSQATHLFADTIRANLLLGRPDADDAALWTALDEAAIGDLVRGLPDRLDAWVGEGGANFSGGQARRLALARTLLSPAPVLILDEPCAGLDAETERAFLLTLNDAAPGRTIVLIAHRLLGIERLDRIWRLSAGRAVPAAA